MKDEPSRFNRVHTHPSDKTGPRRKLDQINRVRTINELKVPPGNRLERLKGDRENQYSIRINQQYRICFIWEDGHAYEIEITDYH
jgi:proteic killer suppression protein